MAENEPHYSEIQGLNDARNIARELDSKILERIKEKQKNRELPDIRKRFDEILARHTKVILVGASKPSTKHAKNLFELVGAMKLVRANVVSRLVSTHLGSGVCRHAPKARPVGLIRF